MARHKSLKRLKQDARQALIEVANAEKCDEDDRMRALWELRELAKTIIGDLEEQMFAV